MSSSSPVSQSLPGGSLFFLAGSDGDQLLGSFGDVVGALDDLLGEQLVVHCAGRRVGGRRFTTLYLQAGRTGPQELQGGTYCIQRWSLREADTTDLVRLAGYLEAKYQHKTPLLTLGNSEAISVTAKWIFSEHGTKLQPKTDVTMGFFQTAAKGQCNQL